jgi:multidrug efflux pump subunit AcrB
MNLAEYTLRKRVIAWVLTALVLLGGYWSYKQLGRFEDPEFVIRQAVVVTAYPGASPEQVAEEITDLIEGAVQQLQEVKKITSVSRAGESLVKVEAKLEFSKTQQDLDLVWQKLRNKIAEVQRALPPGAAQPVVKGDFGDVFALFYAVTGEGYSPRQLYDYVDFLRRELMLLPGVAKVVIQGERKEAIFVEISHARAAQFGIPLDKVYAALQAQNVITAAGSVVAGELRLQIQPKALVDSVASLRNLIIAGDTQKGLVRLLDIADVRRDYITPPSALIRYDGLPAIGLGVANVQGGNVVDMGEAVKRRLAQLEAQRPLGMDVNIISFQSDSVREAVDGFVANLLAAVAIVVIVLLFFMGVRSGLIIGAIWC